MEIISNNALLTINATLVVQLISFLIFVALINRIMVRPLLRTMGQRKDYFDQLRQEIEGAKLTITERTQALQEHESTVKTEAWGLKGVIETEGLRESTEIEQQVHQEIISIQRQAEQDIQAQISLEKEKLQKEARMISHMIMEKVLNRSLPA